jgi:hypothetical protein
VGNGNDDISSEEHFEDSDFYLELLIFVHIFVFYIVTQSVYNKYKNCKDDLSSIFFAEREAGFYTTRFGRADPLMRIQELQARLHSHQQHEDPGSLIQASLMTCPCSKCPEMEFLNGIFSRGFWA